MYYFRHVRRIEISLPREIKVNIKVKIFPAHAMKAYRGVGGGGSYKIAPLILNLGAKSNEWITSLPDRVTTGK
jgi:hypothetical protein